MNSYFLDVNVWLALTLDTHEHHSAATTWFTSLPASFELLFCRFTQVGLLRLLTLRSASGASTMTQRQAWQAYDRWFDLGGAVFVEEPLGIEVEFRALTTLDQPAPNNYTDSYLAAFANALSVELVTFDKVLSRRVRRAILLRPVRQT